MFYRSISWMTSLPTTSSLKITTPKRQTTQDKTEFDFHANHVHCHVVVNNFYNYEYQ